jgi:hypothetical protein
MQIIELCDYEEMKRLIQFKDQSAVFSRQTLLWGFQIMSLVYESDWLSDDFYTRKWYMMWKVHS